MIDRTPTARPRGPGHRPRTPPSTGTWSRRRSSKSRSRAARGASPRTARWSSRPASTPAAPPRTSSSSAMPRPRSTVWWGKTNKGMTPEHFAALKADFLAALAGKDTLFVAGSVRRIAARASRQCPRHQRARLAQPVHPHPAGAPGRRASCRLRCPNTRSSTCRASAPIRRVTARRTRDGDRGQFHREADPDRRHRLCRRDEEVGVRHPQLSAARRRA